MKDSYTYVPIIWTRNRTEFILIFLNIVLQKVHFISFARCRVDPGATAHICNRDLVISVILPGAAARYVNPYHQPPRRGGSSDTSSTIRCAEVDGKLIRHLSLGETKRPSFSSKGNLVYTRISLHRGTVISV